METEEKTAVENSVENVDNSLNLYLTATGYVKHKTARGAGAKKGETPDKRRFFQMRKKSKNSE